MTKQEIRIKCLEFCNRHDQTPDQIVARAKALEAYISQDVVEDSVSGERSLDAPRGRGRPPKSGNAKLE